MREFSFIKFIKLEKFIPDKRLVSGVVYSPNEVDLQDDFASEDVIEAAAHDFLIKSRMIKLQHNQQAMDVDLVESHVAPASFSMNGQTVVKGSWIITVKINNQQIWEKITNGEISGFSMGGTAERPEQLSKENSDAAGTDKSKSKRSEPSGHTSKQEGISVL